MNKVQKKLIFPVLFTVLVLSSLFMHEKALAAKGDLKIYIGNDKTARHHRALVLGSQSDVFSYELTVGTVKKHEFKSSDESIFKVIDDSGGKCKLQTVKEGTGWLILNVTDTKDKKYEEKVYISVYTSISSHKAELNKDSSVYRGASVNAGVENSDNKGNLKKSTIVSVIAQCNEFYLLKTKDGATFDDGKDTGFVKKENINILVNSIKLDKNNSSLAKGDSLQMNLEISPDIAANKDVSWQSSQEKTGTVDKNGKVFAKAEGVICVKVKAKDTGGAEAECYITIYKPVTECNGVTKQNGCELYKRGDGKVVRGTIKKGANVSVVGECKDYYRIKVTDNVFTDGDTDSYCYIEKKKLTIPVTSIRLSQTSVKMEPKQKLKLSVAIEPAMASNKTVTWSSNNKKVLSINSKGEMTAKKIGTAIVTASSSDGSKTAQCKVSVTEKHQISTYIPRRPTITVDNYSDKKIKLTVTQNEPFQGMVLYNKNKKMAQYAIKHGGKVKYHVYYIDKLEMGEKYNLKIKTYSKNSSKTTYSKFSNTVKFRMGKMDFTINQVTQNAVCLSWKKLKKVSYYEVSRKTGRGAKWKVIAKPKPKKDSYKDTKLKTKKEYYYRVRPVWKEEKGVYSSSKSIGLVLFGNVQKYLAKKYPLICMSKNRQINTYNVNGKYVPIKYKMVDNKLEIHVYLEFVQYTNSNKKDRYGDYIFMKKESTDYGRINRFKTGITNGFSDLQIIGGNGDFKKGIDFQSKLIIHDRKAKEKYNGRQLFIEVLMGGECPDCTSEGDHWYHHCTVNGNADDYVEYKDTSVIFIPTDEQVMANKKKGYNIPHDDLESVCAHELGHAFGLEDAYYDDVNKVDRCAENNETAVYFRLGDYDNLMKNSIRVNRAKANDIEMILFAYTMGKGYPTKAFQYYNKFYDKIAEEENKISKVIIDTHDELIEQH